MVHTLFAEGLTRPRAVRRRRRRGRGGGRAVHPRGWPSRSPASRPTRSAGSPASSPPPTAAGVRPGRRVDAPVRHRLPVGDPAAQHPDREPRPPGGVMFTSPPWTRRAPARRPGHHGLWRSRVRGAAGVRRRAAGAAVMREEIETPGRRPDPRDADAGRQPGAVDARRRAARRGARALDFMAAVDIYVNETTRHADVILPPTTALERDHYDIVFHLLAVRNTARFTPAVLPKPEGALHDWRDLPRARPARAAPAGRPAAAADPAPAAGPARPQPDALIVAGLLRTGGGDDAEAAARAPGGRRPRPAAADDARAAATKDQRSTSPRPRARRPAAAAGWLDERLAAGARRAGADRAPAQAGQQLLDPQHRAGQPRAGRGTSC